MDGMVQLTSPSNHTELIWGSLAHHTNHDHTIQLPRITVVCKNWQRTDTLIQSHAGSCRILKTDKPTCYRHRGAFCMPTEAHVYTHVHIQTGAFNEDTRN